jgi:protein CpxP
MSSLQLFKIAIAVLVVLNVSLLTVYLLKDNNRSRERPMGPNFRSNQRGGNIIDDIEGGLKLDEEQRKGYQEYRQAHMKGMQRINKDHSELLNKYFKTLKKEDGSDEQRNALLLKIQDLEKERIEITYAHFEKIKLLCNDEQLEYFPKVLDNAINFLLSKRKNGRPPMPRYRP